MAEGDDEGPAVAMAEKLSKLINERCRVSVLGYIQRGGNPTRMDRILATRLGAFAIECLQKGTKGVMLGEMGGRLTTTPYEQTWSKKKPLDEYLLGFIDELAG